MKGIVFTEFVEMVETLFSPTVADRILTETRLPSGGVYTAVGTYDHREMVALVTALSEAVGQPAPELLRAFGRYLFARFVELYPPFFEGITASFEFLGKVDRYIHVEVRKLYPDAELPQIETDRPRPDQMILVYRSQRCLHELAHGLIEGCAAHFGEEIGMEKEDLSNGAGSCVRFTLTRVSGR